MLPLNREHEHPCGEPVQPVSRRSPAGQGLRNLTSADSRTCVPRGVVASVGLVDDDDALIRVQHLDLKGTTGSGTSGRWNTNVRT